MEFARKYAIFRFEIKNIEESISKLSQEKKRYSFTTLQAT